MLLTPTRVPPLRNLPPKGVCNGRWKSLEQNLISHTASAREHACTHAHSLPVRVTSVPGGWRRGISGRLGSEETPGSSTEQQTVGDPRTALPAPSAAPRRVPALSRLPAGSVAPLSLSHLRRCVPGRARGRAGRRGGARRGRAPGAWHPLGWLCPAAAAGVSAAVRARGSVAAAGPRHCPSTPPCADAVGVGQRPASPREAGRGAVSPGEQPGSRKRNFSLPPPAPGPQP
jgi:hypothetical protein